MPCHDASAYPVVIQYPADTVFISAHRYIMSAVSMDWLPYSSLSEGEENDIPHISH